MIVKFLSWMSAYLCYFLHFWYVKKFFINKKLLIKNKSQSYGPNSEGKKQLITLMNL